MLPPGILEALTDAPSILQKVREGIMKKLDPNHDGHLNFDEYVSIAKLTSGNRFTPQMGSFTLGNLLG